MELEPGDTYTFTGMDFTLVNEREMHADMGTYLEGLEVEAQAGAAGSRGPASWKVQEPYMARQEEKTKETSRERHTLRTSCTPLMCFLFFVNI